MEKKLSLGLARVTGAPPDHQGVNLRSEIEQTGEGRSGKKASGLLMVDGVLWMLLRNADNARLARSTDHGRSWIRADWKFTRSFGYPTFLNFGRNYAGARDDFVYIYSPDSDSAYKPADRMVLARVPKTRLGDRSSFEFFQGWDAQGRPVWTDDIEQRGAVFEHPGRCYRSGITYNPGLERYLWVQTIPDIAGEKADTRFEGEFGIYDASEPWGPWTTVFFTERWDTGPGETACFPTKWMSEDGRMLSLVFSGGDAFSVRRARLRLHD